MYLIQNDKGDTREASTIEAALCKAVLMIYMGEETRRQAKKELEQGKPFAAAYGFKSVTITPTN
jgi:hypothetical protein